MRSDGSLIWSTLLDPDLNAISTASPIIYKESLMWEFPPAKKAGPIRHSGEAWSQFRWRTGRSFGRLISRRYNYSGAPVWSSTPVIDVTRSQIYVTTGNNYLVPVSVQMCEQAVIGNSGALLACQAENNYDDSIVALDLATGNVKWAHRCMLGR